LFRIYQRIVLRRVWLVVSKRFRRDSCRSSAIPPVSVSVDKTAWHVVDFDDADAAARTFLADWTKGSAHYDRNRRRDDGSIRVQMGGCQ